MSIINVPSPAYVKGGAVYEALEGVISRDLVGVVCGLVNNEMIRLDCAKMMWPSSEDLSISRRNNCYACVDLPGVINVFYSFPWAQHMVIKICDSCDLHADERYFRRLWTSFGPPKPAGGWPKNEIFRFIMFMPIYYKVMVRMDDGSTMHTNIGAFLAFNGFFTEAFDDNLLNMAYLAANNNSYTVRIRDILDLDVKKKIMADVRHRLVMSL